MLSTNGIFSTAKYSCSPGYNLHGETDVECSANGNWNSSAPVCSKAIYDILRLSEVMYFIPT